MTAPAPAPAPVSGALRSASSSASSGSPASAPPPRARVLAAYAAVYIIWGSTYLAIHFAIQTLPPFLMAGARFLVAGTVLYAWTRARGAARPAPVTWRSALVVGALLLTIGNGAVVWAELRVPSGIAALLVSTVPLWMVLLGTFERGGTRPTPRVGLGIALGIVGVVVLVGPGSLLGHGNVDPIGAATLTLAALAWSAGSLYARRSPRPPSATLGTAMEMLCGGALLVVVGALTGELAPLAHAHVSTTSLLALLYLIVFGSLIGYSAYSWLIQVEPPSRASTYAYVNPVVAVGLGWLLAGEPITMQTLIAAAIIIAAVAMIVGRRRG